MTRREKFRLRPCKGERSGTWAKVERRIGFLPLWRFQNHVRVRDAEVFMRLLRDEP